ncbi:hypothetical protein CERZMDRAFT_83047 [Cercospora zeae-maydis SCOH1-5]|uniref:Uncharacterized protein n=1 Tax=Cercospora zeae-maydis SCOH1-5 TaxID=717836 RepID=A0A6A6FLS5_9PEZI|nr:hypothetical protein CERZMDRAFT_83047 [Cercospora zeae-maydis SCOH1-5]
MVANIRNTMSFRHLSSHTCHLITGAQSHDCAQRIAIERELLATTITFAQYDLHVHEHNVVIVIWSFTFHSMESSSNIVPANTAEQVSQWSGLADLFTDYLQDYLTRQGLDEAFVKENITAQVILDSFRNIQHTTIPPAPSGPRSGAQRLSDHVCTGHLQRYLIDNDFDPSFARQITGVHIYNSVISEMPEELLPKLPSVNANKKSNTPETPAKAPRKDSFLASKSSPDSEDDSEDDMPLIRRRATRKRYMNEVRSGRISKHIKPKKLDLSKTYHKIQTACLANIELSEDSSFNSHISSKAYDKFLASSATFLAPRFAAVSVTLARAGQDERAEAFGQFGIDLLGPAIYNAYVAYHEQYEDEDDETLLQSRMALIDCLDEIHNTWSIGVASSFKHLIVDHNMWWSSGQR